MTIEQQGYFIGLGEILWDVLPAAKMLGGAPANFAFHSHQFGNPAAIVSRIGADSLGREIRSNLKAISLDDDFLQIDSQHPTGTVTVEVDENGQPAYVVHEHAAWDFLELNQPLIDLFNHARVICYGSLAQRSAVSRKTILDLLDHRAADAVALCDINLRQQYYTDETIHNSLFAADILKLNHEEFPIIAEITNLPYKNFKDRLHGIMDKFNLKLLCVTRASNGCVLCSRDELVEHPGFPVSVQDAIGAGDAFTATMAHLYIQNATLETIAIAANQVGAYVASCPGATPQLPANLKQTIMESKLPPDHKSRKSSATSIP